IDLAFVEFFFMEDDFFAVNSFNPEFLNQKYRDHRDQNGAANDAEHVERLQPEHFLDAEPADYFSFDEQDSEQNSHHQIFQIMVPLVLQTAFVHTHGVEGS